MRNYSNRANAVIHLMAANTFINNGNDVSAISEIEKALSFLKKNRPGQKTGHVTRS